LKKLVILLIIFSASCTKPILQAPSDFTVFDKSPEYKAVSFDGIHIKIKTIKDNDFKENSDSELWLTEIESVLSTNGYSRNDTTLLTLNNGKNAHYREYLNIYNAEEYIYSICLIIDSAKFIIIEAGGRRDIYMKYKTEILNSYQSVKF